MLAIGKLHGSNGLIAANYVDSHDAEEHQRFRLNRDCLFALAHKEHAEENKQLTTILLYWSVGLNILLGLGFIISLATR